MIKNLNTLLILIALFFLGCDNHTSKFNDKEDQISSSNFYKQELIDPVYVTSDSIQLNLNDFFSNAKTKYKVLRIPEGLELVNNDSFGSITFKGKINTLYDYFSIEFLDEKTDISLIDIQSLSQLKQKKLEAPLLTICGDSNNLDISSNQEVNFMTFYKNKFVSISKGMNLSGDIPQEAINEEYSILRVFAFNENGVSNPVSIPLIKGKPILNSKDLPTNDFHRYIFYSILVDRFYDGNSQNNYKVGEPEVKPEVDFRGGDLKGVIAKIKQGYFNDLGVNVLLVSSLLENPKGSIGLFENDFIKTKYSSYHGYWPKSFIKIDRRYGNEKELDDLIKIAHSKGIKVIIDFPINEIHKTHPLVKEHPKWFVKNTSYSYKLNTKNFNSLNSISDSISFFLNKYNFDGINYRIMNDNAYGYLKSISKNVVRKIKNKKSFIEVFGINSFLDDNSFYFNKYGFDKLSTETSGKFENFNQYKSINITGDYFAPRFVSKMDGLNLDAKDFWINKTNNNNEFAFDKLLQLIAYNSTKIGMPLIFQGDELGIPGLKFPDNHKNMIFNLDSIGNEESWIVKGRKKVFTQTKELLNLRKENIALQYGNQVELYNQDGVYVFMRTYLGDSVISVFNFNNDRRQIKFELSDIKNLFQLKSIFARSFILKNNELKLSLEANSFDILINK